MLDSLLRNVRDAGDVLRRARNPVELMKGLMPQRWLSPRVLNAGPIDAVRSDASEVAQSLRKLRNELKAAVIDGRGRIDYQALRAADGLERMRADARRLRAADLGVLVEDAGRIAFWINVYNVLAIHGVLELGITKSVMEVPSFFGVVCYDVGGFVLSLDDIENGVLRKNAPHPATGTPPFRTGDPRLSLSPSYVDPRIHAALVCASTSCPPVAFYDADELDAQLNVATAGYIASDVEVEDATRVVRLPITFRYYERDFGGTDGTRAFLSTHAPPELRTRLEAAFEADYGFDYHRYDWSLNRV